MRRHPALLDEEETPLLERLFELTRDPGLARGALRLADQDAIQMGRRSRFNLFAQRPVARDLD